MPRILGDASQFTQRIANALECVWLFGAALTAPDKSGGPGVPGVDGVVSMIRRRYEHSRPDLDLFEAALAAQSKNRYQAAFQHLHQTHGPDEVGRVIREAVLKGRTETDAGLAARVVEGEIAACRLVESDLAGWYLSDAVSSVGQIVTRLPERFGRYVLTTNFDPLIETGIRRAGGVADRN
jgi:hypothetical protein